MDFLSENDSIYTKLRIMDCALQTFDIIVNDQLVDFYIEVINKLWIYDIYDIMYKYISVSNKNIYFKKNTESKKSYKIE
mgnify:CR=1 FL=1